MMEKIKFRKKRSETSVVNIRGGNNDMREGMSEEKQNKRVLGNKIKTLDKPNTNDFTSGFLKSKPYLGTKNIPLKETKILQLLNKRQQEDLLASHVSEMYRLKWEEEKAVLEQEKSEREEKYRELILRKRKFERQELERRLLEAKNKFEAQQKELNLFLDMKEKKSAILLTNISVSQQLARLKKSLEESAKRDQVKVVLQNMNILEEKQKHIQIEKEKLDLAKARKEKKIKLEKKQVDILNRYYIISFHAHMINHRIS